jgi:hypothetical protein
VRLRNVFVCSVPERCSSCTLCCLAQYLSLALARSPCPTHTTITTSKQPATTTCSTDNEQRRHRQRTLQRQPWQLRARSSATTLRRRRGTPLALSDTRGLGSGRPDSMRPETFQSSHRRRRPACDLHSCVTQPGSVPRARTRVCVCVCVCDGQVRVLSVWRVRGNAGGSVRAGMVVQVRLCRCGCGVVVVEVWLPQRERDERERERDVSRPTCG